MSIKSSLLYYVKLVFLWLKARIQSIHQYDSRFWIIISCTLFVGSSVTVVTGGLGSPTGLGTQSDIVIYFTANIIMFTILTAAISFLLSLMYVPVPRIFMGSVLYTGYVTFFVLNTANLGIQFSIIVAVSYTLIVLLIGLFIVFLANRNISLHVKTISCFVPISLAFLIFFWPFSGKPATVVFSEIEIEDIIPLEIENPAEPGTYPVTHFTYGSGLDLHRSEFGSNVDLISTSVDASQYIRNWKREREIFWGFDQTELPLNGRVWMPKGEGPFPLVLVVHGNHTMEYFSDEGYEYLGELLASRGFITISVDQNYINYSNWTGSAQRNYEMRAWNLLQHILQIKEFHSMTDTPFFEKVDLQQIALMGHSRGGQAAAMAADYKAWFEEDDSLQGLEEIKIQAVVGMAPTDRGIDGQFPNLNDTYYLVLHGAEDGDVHNFRGERQYNRTNFETGSDRFKASLYIAGANHSQFNTDWGRSDMSLPGGLFLSRSNFLSPEEQRQIAKVYISAFLETALYGVDEYLPLFRDYRYGQHWLPSTQYLSRFENGMFVPVTEFDRNRNKEKFPNDITVETEGFTTWEISAAEDRGGNRKNTDGVVLEWTKSGTYTIHLTDSFWENNVEELPDSLVVSIANMERDILDELEVEELPTQVMEVEVELIDGDTISLEEELPITPKISTQYTIIQWFDDIFRDGKYSESSEPVFHTFEIPLETLDDELDPTNISKITFHFKNGPGKIMLDDIGFISF